MRRAPAAAALAAALSSMAAAGIDPGFERTVLFGEPSEVAALLDRRPDWVRARDRFGFTALHLVMCEERFAACAC